MKIETLSATPDPMSVVIKSARGDHRSEWVGNTTVEQLIEESGSENGEEFVHRLMDRGHWGVFEHVHISFAVKGMSRVCMAQLTRHRHMSFDVQSLRYTDVDDGPVDDHTYVPPTLGIENQNYNDYYSHMKDSFLFYQNLLDDGVPAEDARFVLPLATTVNLTFSGNLRSMLHLMDMRKAGEAQQEIREFSKMVMDELKEWCPEVVEYFDDEFHPRVNKLSP